MNNKKAGKPALGKGIASLIQANSTQSFLSQVQEMEKKERIPAMMPQAPAVHEGTPAPAPVTAPKENAEGGLYLVDINQIHTNPNQPRKIFKEKEIEELAQSIKENGIIQPLVVTPAKEGFELVAGERRLRACRKLGLEKVPVVVKKVTDREKLVVALIENVQRAELNCVEEALAYFQLMEDFHLTQDEVAQKIGKDRSTIANFLRLLKLPRMVVEYLQKEQLSFGHAKVLAGVKESELLSKLATEAVKKGLSVRELEALVKTATTPAAPKTAKGIDPAEAKFLELKEKLEKRLGLHFKISGKAGGTGMISIVYNNEAEFNDIYEILLRAGR